METLCTNDRKAAVGIAKDEDCIRLCLIEEFVGTIDDVATGGAKVIAYGIHIDFGILELEVVEEYTIEVVVVVLTGMGKDDIEILAALVDDSCKADDLRACTDYETEFEFTVFLPLNI